ncbi:SUN domain-containing protein 2-like [Salminus brasiliensis]|uniref:SUN domain-containing protein 2-like n=1 Tax=Salminus brasiliensis TaxID=930266 RepID=UPI003B836290
MDTPQAPSITVVQREIAFLKEGRWKQKHLIEELKTKLKDLKFSMRKDDLDKRVWFEQQTAGFHRQITEIKADVSSLHTAALKNLLKSQEQDYDKLKAELSTWLQQQLLLACRSQASAVPHAKLQEALKALQTRLMDRFREELAKEREDLWRSVLETVTGLIKQVADDTVQKALRLYRADGVGMADFALESIGSRIIHSRCSESYHSKLAVLSLFGIPLLDSTQGPRTIIQPEVYPGKCWALNGNHGFATISLAYPVCITHVTLEHLPKELSPTGQISNAPKEFSVYGMRDELEEEGTLLGMFVYDYDGEPVQTFELPEYARDVYPVVQLRVQSNWGHPAYTCIYRFRVHGQLRTVMHT